MAESDYFLHDVATVHYHDGGGILHFGGALKYGVVTTQLPAARAAGKLVGEGLESG